MKLKILFMFGTLGALSVMPLIYIGKFEPMTFFENSLSKGATEFDKLKNSVPKNLPAVAIDKKVRIYKWRDKNGVMQFSNTPPADGTKAAQIEVNPSNNLMQAVKVPVQKEQTQGVAKVEKPAPYSFKGMKKTMDDAKGIEALLQKQHEERQKVINDF